MSQKSISSVKQIKSPLQLPPEDLPSKISTSKRLVSPSLMFSYFNDSHCYLNRKHSENNAIFLNSNNFIRKDSLCPNNDKTSNNEEEDMVDSEENESDNEYNQLTANGVYNQQYINQPKLPLFRLTLNQQFNLMTQNQIKQQQRPRFNSGNFAIVPNTFNFQSPYQGEMYGKKGWVCTSVIISIMIPETSAIGVIPQEEEKRIRIIMRIIDSSVKGWEIGYVLTVRI